MTKIKVPALPPKEDKKHDSPHSGHVHVPHVGDKEKNPEISRVMSALFGKKREICCCGNPSCRIGPFNTETN